MRTRKTTPADIPALKAIWDEAFAEDARQDIDEFFETLYPNATGFCAEDETGCVCAMLFALPQTIVKGEKQLKAAYLYAVATKKACRGKGYRLQSRDGVCRKGASQAVRGRASFKPLRRRILRIFMPDSAFPARRAEAN
ncbi:MAG: GNAT family N-acetyltransferase [Oscillospiraceae bacterium]